MARLLPSAACNPCNDIINLRGCVMFSRLWHTALPVGNTANSTVLTGLHPVVWALGHFCGHQDLPWIESIIWLRTVFLLCPRCACSVSEWDWQSVFVGQHYLIPKPEACPFNGSVCRALAHFHSLFHGTMPYVTMCNPVASLQQVAKLACIMLRTPHRIITTYVETIFYKYNPALDFSTDQCTMEKNRGSRGH